jgi:hypothetical protein
MTRPSPVAPARARGDEHPATTEHRRPGVPVAGVVPKSQTVTVPAGPAHRDERPVAQYPTPEQVVHAPSWNRLLRTAPNPNARTTGEAIAAALTSEEAERVRGPPATLG